jgi:hypothetical protein
LLCRPNTTDPLTDGRLEASFSAVTLVMIAIWATLHGLSFAALASPNADVPATPLMTVYQFDGPQRIPYYAVDQFLRSGPTSPAGGVAQGTAVIPCIVVRKGQPVTDDDGTPYVGFEIVVDTSAATPAAHRFTEVFEQRRAVRVSNHHCPPETTYVMDVRKLYPLGKPPRFDPPRPEAAAPLTRAARGELDAIVQAFHASSHCDAVNRRLMGRREALRQAWTAFIADSQSRWPAASLDRARHLDFVMRTALYEGHLGRGCNAYGACERNVIALSIRNRARERCLSGQGCSAEGDFEGVASKVSQYNIWDEQLTQTSGVTSCFLRPDLTGVPYYAKLRAMYEQSIGDIEKILFGGSTDLQRLFPGNSPQDLLALRHYYHPPAMGKCFPHHRRLEYMSGAIARRGETYVLIANTRIEIGERRGDGYLFKQAVIEDDGERDVVRVFDRYPGFIVDGRLVKLEPSTRCSAYGVPSQCRFERVGRHRKTPGWLSSGKPFGLNCRIASRGEDCRGEAVLEKATVGGRCDTSMQPVAGVP